MFAAAPQTTIARTPPVWPEGLSGTRPETSPGRRTRWHSGPVRRLRYDLLGTLVEAVRIGSAQPQWVEASNLTDYKEQLIAAMDADNGVVLCVDGTNRLVMLHPYRYSSAA